MPRIGMEPQRREALVRATIAEIAVSGARDITVARIAKRAGMSPALAHHYFGSKERMLLAAMRRILSDFATEARKAVSGAESPHARLEAIVRASFGPANFDAEVVAAWLNFYVQAHRDPDARRLLHIYHARLRSNLVHALRPLTSDPEGLAEGIGALIDGLYMRQALRRTELATDISVGLVLDYIERGLAR
ncbi:transcriptional regulator, TetR family [Jannaschia faecimaris]|uniref:HTH-type transcriptional regulator BetI n=1 Tax=Jannaschia faecimaris TaxID=1244108 RepID=A0A1H3JSS2_9RHOB|nr:transcriptional regulator BetI [Jannaschia faecimaris]SDY42565.1 transcriptional regulator, TetR family [Jannaschia faecimaris]